MAKADLTAQSLRAILKYNPKSGVFTRLVTAGGHLAGTVAGGPDLINGYIRLRIGGRLYPAHRVAWLYMTGEWPVSLIDHINRVKTDNRWVNLRLVSASQNNQNRALANTGTKSGLRGVDWCKQKKSNPWRSVIKHNGKHIHIGYFSSAEEAHLAYLSKKSELHSHCPPFSIEAASS